MCTQLYISKKLLKFGECPVNDRADILVELRNYGKILPLEFKITKVAHFSAKPARGKLMPGQSLNVVFTFRPTQMGQFEDSVNLMLAAGIVKLPIKVLGSSNTVRPGATTTTRGKTVFKFVNTTTAVNTRTKFTRVAPFDSTKTDPYIFQMMSSPSYTYSINELATIANHKNKYTSYLRSNFAKRTKRKEITIRKTFGAGYQMPKLLTIEDMGVDLGIQPRSGMVSPTCPLPKTVDELWLEIPLDAGKGKRKKGKRGINMYDPDRLITKKFKPKPKTQTEIRDCATTLTSSQLLLVTAGPKVLEFGRVCIRSKTTKCFAVTNDLSQNVLVAMLFEDPAVESSSPKSQVVPAGATAGFDVAFCCQEEQDYKQSVGYVLNGIHQFKFTVTAQVVPISVDMSTEELCFKFEPDDLEFSVTETITLTNPGNAPCEFRWKTKNSTFSVRPPKGVIDAFGTLDVDVTFTPALKQPRAEDLVLLISGGASKTLKCTSDLNDGRCVFRSKKLDFGLIAVGLTHTQKVTLKNPSKSPAVFKVSSAIAGLTLSPTTGLVPPGGVQKLEVRLLPGAARMYDASANFITAHIRCGKSLQLPVVAHAIIPQITIEQDEFEFGEVAIGASVDMELTLKNEGDIPANLILDLSKYPEFSLGMSKKTKRGEKSSSILESLDDEDDESDVRKFRMIVKGEDFLPLRLTFTPKKPGKHAFELPIGLVGISFTPELMRAVVAHGMSPRILLSQSVFDFGQTVISRDQLKHVPHHLTLNMVNAVDVPIEWEISKKLLQLEEYKGVFEIQPSKGTLEPECSCKVRVTFSPEGTNGHEVTLPLYLDEHRERPYLTVRLAGCGVYPRLKFDREEVVLPSVPIGFESRTMFHVLNGGYESLQLGYHLPADTEHMPIKLEFPEGMAIGLAKSKVPVVVSFSSKKPLAFTGRVDFLDHEENCFSINVTGVTDNSLMTLTPFVETHMSDYNVGAKDANTPVILKKKELDDLLGIVTPKPGKSSSRPNTRRLKLMEKERRKKLAARIPAGVTSKTPRWKGGEGRVVYATPEPKPTSKRTLKFLQTWLEVNCFKEPFKNFPGDIVKENGKRVIELIETVSGKSLPGKVTKFARSKIEVTQQILKQYTSMLTVLMGYGALFHNIRPYALMQKDHFMRYRMHNGLGAVKRGDRSSPQSVRRSKKLESVFQELSLETWTYVLFQIIRVFYINSVKLKSYLTMPRVQEMEESYLASLPGAKPAPKDVRRSRKKGKKGKGRKKSTVESRMQTDPTLVDSNLYSQSENLLLRWLNLSYRTLEMEEKPRFARTFEDLADGVILCGTLVAYAPFLADVTAPLEHIITEKSSGEWNDAERARQAKTNFDNFFAALKALGLEYIPDALEFKEINARNMAMIVMVLYTMLPQFLPQTTIEFTGNLGEPLTRELQLRNILKTEVNYSMKISGDERFKLDTSLFKIPPSSTGTLPIHFTSRFSQTTKARLLLMSSKEDGFNRSIIMFNLMSRVKDRLPTHTFTVSTKLYQQQQVVMTVTNPFEVACTFVIELIQERIMVKSSRKGPELEFPDPFTCNVRKIKLGAGETAELTAQFLPLLMGESRASVIFLDEEVGEFMYEVVGTGLAPEPEHHKEEITPIRPSMTQDFIIPQENALFTAASEALKECRAASQHKVLRQQLKDIVDNSKHLKVEVNSPFYSGPPDVTLGGTETKVSLMFQPQEPGTYPVKIVLRSPTQVRVFTASTQVTMAGTEKTLEFSAHARETITQKIPLLNKSETKWNLRAVFAGDKMFAGPNTMSIGPTSTGDYILKFFPKWIGEYEAVLTITNPALPHAKFIYKLIGTGLEPLAEDHVTLTCQARDKITQEFEVKNSSSAQIVYTVESDLPHISGEPTITVPGKSTGVYKLSISPQLGGTYSGSVTFKDPKTGEYRWFTVEVQATSPEPEEELVITADVRKAVSVELTLGNPLDERVDFEAVYNGEGLIGDSHFRLEPEETGVYELIYSPLVAGNYAGSITFTNPLLGEFWYKLKLEARQATPTKLEHMSCAVGTVCSQSFKIENPVDSQLVLISEVENKKNFKVNPSRVTLKPYSSAQVEVLYTPSSLDSKVEESTKIYFSNRKIGQLTYVVSGSGEKPGTMEPIVVTSAVLQSTSASFNFRNPFDAMLSIDVQLSSDMDRASANCFDLLLRTSSNKVAPFGRMHVPFLFAPAAITEYNARLVVSTKYRGEFLSWTYPVKGITEVKVSDIRLSYSCPARETIHEVLSIMPPGLTPKDYGAEFTHELVIPPKYKDKIERSLDINLEKNIIKGGDDGDNLEFRVLFEPLVMFRDTIELVVSKSNGGRWRYRISLEASAPEVDDVIVIESALHRTSSVAFELKNIDNTPAPFEAFFTPNSPAEMTVSPDDGMLAGAQKKPTEFIVSFTPQKYGKIAIGKLVVQTEDMMWSYEVRGVHPLYKKPPGNSKVDNGSVERTKTLRAERSRLSRRR